MQEINLSQENSCVRPGLVFIMVVYPVNEAGECHQHHIQELSFSMWFLATQKCKIVLCLITKAGVNPIFITALHTHIEQNYILNRVLLWRVFPVNWSGLFWVTLLVCLHSQENISWEYYFGATFILLTQP